MALLQRRVARYLARRHRLRREAPVNEVESEELLLVELRAASVQGREALADRGEPSLQGLRPRRTARPACLPGELCASLGGFSLHAKVQLAADERALTVAKRQPPGTPPS